MTQHTMGNTPDQPFPDDWSQAVFTQGLQLIAEGVTELVGFGVACISVVRNNQLEVVAVAADDEVREALKGTSTSIETLLAEPRMQQALTRTLAFAHTRVMNLLRDQADAATVVNGEATNSSV